MTHCVTNFEENKMNKARLMQLRDFLEALPEDKRNNHFSLDAWIRVDGITDGSIELNAEEVPHRRLTRSFFNAAVNPADIIQGHCGSTACAIGWACSNPEFIRLGFRMAAREKVDEYTGKRELTDFTPQYRGSDGWDAVRHFFDIDYHTAGTLFDFEDYPDEGDTTLNEVIARLAELIETGTI
jgi:hypothetical protein